MIRQEVADAQRDTLLEWATAWDQAAADVAERADVAKLLRRAAAAVSAGRVVVVDEDDDTDPALPDTGLRFG